MSKDKRNKLLLVVLMTLIILAGMWFALVKTLDDRVASIAKRRDYSRNKLEQVKQAITNSEKLEAQLAIESAKLAKLEESMASGDLYSWAINTIRQFKLPYKVEIPQYSQIDGPKDTSMLPGFPYRQATLTIGGTASFYDFGRFLADFENQFPFIRVENLTLEPVPAAATATDREKLQFRLDIIALVKPNAS